MTDTPLPNRDVLRILPNGVAVLTGRALPSLARTDAAASEAITRHDAMPRVVFVLGLPLFNIPTLRLLRREGEPDVAREDGCDDVCIESTLSFLPASLDDAEEKDRLGSFCR